MARARLPCGSRFVAGAIASKLILRFVVGVRFAALRRARRSLVLSTHSLPPVLRSSFGRGSGGGRSWGSRSCGSRAPRRRLQCRSSGDICHRQLHRRWQRDPWRAVRGGDRDRALGEQLQTLGLRWNCGRAGRSTLLGFFAIAARALGRYRSTLCPSGCLVCSGCRTPMRSGSARIALLSRSSGRGFSRSGRFPAAANHRGNSGSAGTILPHGFLRRKGSLTSFRHQ